MNKSLLLLCAFLFAVMSSAAVFADDQPIYKWTDAQGTVHYSDKPPKETSADLQTLDLPPFPPQDPAKIAAAEAAQAASTMAVLQQLQAQTVLQQQQAALAQQQAQIQASLDAMQQSTEAEPEPAPIYAINAGSRFIPRSYRRNLYVPHPSESHRSIPMLRPAPSRAAVPMLAKP